MSTLNVLRYSALALGVVFGFKNSCSLKCEASKAQEENAYQAKLKLVEQAKKEFAAQQPKKEATGEINLEDPNLDYTQVVLNAVESL